MGGRSTVFATSSSVRTRNRAGGFTFIDTILMMVILGVGLTGMMSFFVSSNRQALDADQTVQASVLAQEKLDQIIANKIALGYNAIVAANYPVENLGAPFAGLTRTTTITEVSPNDLSTASPGSGLKRVNIVVSWGVNANQAVQLTTMVTAY
ncbi:MAG: hypothetical protein HY696_07515 [Deltaproteobacteria bacterium]|nr:hypothetical protein [Deltaproteobacteria bacterium]